MADTALIYRVRQMETIYQRHITQPNEHSYLMLFNYFLNQWADDRDYIFSETDFAFSIFKPSQLASLFESEYHLMMSS